MGWALSRYGHVTEDPPEGVHLQNNMSSLPSSVQVREVGPRDGFQNEPEIIPTERKVELIDMLARTGLRRLEVTSFVRPEVIPQLADAPEVLARIDVPEEVSVSVLIPNGRGLERALAVREKVAEQRSGGSAGRPGRLAFDEINVFLSASETHNRHNVNRSVEESLLSLEEVLPSARAGGLRCEAVISTSFGCPYEGHVAPERVLEIAARLRDAGAQEIGFGDTTGMANPVQVGAFFEQAFERLGTGAADRPLPQHARPGSCQRARRAAGRRHELRVELSASWAAAQCRLAPPATSPARISSRCCTRWVSRRASNWMLCSSARAASKRYWAARSARTRSWPALIGWRYAALLAHRRHAVLLHRHLHLQGLRERGTGRGVDHSLGAADRHMRVGQQLVHERLGCLLQLRRAPRLG